jgi:cellulose synthase/poly-beta-1,6-N-acetylglucosamine synthase-like glycosyltransferase
MISHVAVIVPANDEQDHIDGCLSAIDAAQRDLARHFGKEVRSRVIVVLDDCHDATAAVVNQWRDVHTVSCSAHQVGIARRVGTAAALTAFDMPPIPLAQVWLVNTDADSRVPPHWLTRMVQFANAGADVVLGTVTPGPGLTQPVEDAWHSLHHVKEGHPHVHGTNFGIRADTYIALGGWSSLSTGEDVDLATRASLGGYVICRTARVPVVTSTRAVARAPLGFSSYLCALTAQLAGT